jgi:hypothetical protein
MNYNRFRRPTSPATKAGKILLGLVGVVALLVAIPVGLYVWFIWGWYEGLTLVYNSIANASGAGDFAWGVVKFLAGNFLGVLSGIGCFFIGGACLAGATS